MMSNNFHFETSLIFRFFGFDLFGVFVFLGGWVKGQKFFGVYPYRLATFVFQVLLYYHSFMQFEFGILGFLFFLLFFIFCGVVSSFIEHKGLFSGFGYGLKDCLGFMHKLTTLIQLISCIKIVVDGRLWH